MKNNCSGNQYQSATLAAGGHGLHDDVGIWWIRQNMNIHNKNYSVYSINVNRRTNYHQL